jgi:hypothetical protein
MSKLPQLAGPLDPEEAGPLPALDRAAALDQLPLAHHPQHPLAVDRHAEPAPDERRRSLDRDLHGLHRTRRTAVRASRYIRSSMRLVALRWRPIVLGSSG